MAAKTRKPRRKVGRPTTYNEKTREKIELLARKGFTDNEMAQVLGVTEQTFNNWKRRHRGFFEALKGWKLKADEDVERSLYERACGYEHPETKAQYVQGTDGAPGGWETLDMIKHYPPDSTSMIFWLKNRQPKKWRDKQDHTVSNPDGSNVTFNIIGVSPGDRPKDT